MIWYRVRTESLESLTNCFHRGQRSLRRLPSVLGAERHRLLRDVLPVQNVQSVKVLNTRERLNFITVYPVVLIISSLISCTCVLLHFPSGVSRPTWSTGAH